MRFTGKKVLITGGTSGLGLAAALEFAGQGAEVGICGLDKTLGEQALAEIRKVSCNAFFSKVDVRYCDQLEKFVSRFLARFGSLDIALNAAGVNNPPHRLADIPLEEYRDVLATNLDGVFHAMKAQIPAMQKNGGVIINVASILTLKRSGWMAAYSASKAGVVALSQAASEDYRGSGIRVYSLSPGPLQTPMFARALKDIAGEKEKYAGGFPKGGRGMEPAKAAKVILDLADPETAPESGTNLALPE